MILAAVLALGLSAQAAPSGPLAGAETAYRAGDYAAAKAAYLAWIGDHDDGRVEYDLGNCEFRLGDYARALWRYERARRRLGDREELLFNRSLAIRKLGRVEVGDKGFAASVGRRLRAFEAADWYRLALPLELLGLALLGWTLRRRRLVPAVLAAVCLAAGIGGFARALVIPADRVLGVIVLDDRTPLRAEPRADLPAIMRLSAGLRARFVARTEDWVEVRVRGRAGWLPRSSAGLW